MYADAAHVQDCQLPMSALPGGGLGLTFKLPPRPVPSQQVNAELPPVDSNLAPEPPTELQQDPGLAPMEADLPPAPLAPLKLRIAPLRPPAETAPLPPASSSVPPPPAPAPPSPPPPPPPPPPPTVPLAPPIAAKAVAPIALDAAFGHRLLDIFRAHDPHSLLKEALSHAFKYHEKRYS